MGQPVREGSTDEFGREEQTSPLAPGARVELVGVWQVSALVADWKALFEIDITDELSGLSEIRLYECSESGLQFFRPEEATGSESLYEKLARFDWFYMREKWEFDRALRDLQDSERVLEVGCGPGFFLEAARERLPRARLEGIELGAAAVARARSAGLHVEAIPLSDVVRRGERYDAVCAFQVLEHVPRPGALIGEMLSVLRPGGRLIISTPNRESFLKHQHNLLDLPPHHMSRWAARTFRWLPEAFPLRLEQVAMEPLASYHVTGYVFAHGVRARERHSTLGRLLSDERLHRFARLLTNTRAYRILRGQTLYAAYTCL